jgi:hypothetical protein
MAVVYGFYYVCWEAVNQEVARLGMEHFLTYPNDLADVNNDYLNKALEYGAKSLSDESNEVIGWQRHLADTHSSRRKDVRDSLGTIIRRDECG